MRLAGNTRTTLHVMKYMIVQHISGLCDRTYILLTNHVAVWQSGHFRGGNGSKTIRKHMTDAKWQKINKVNQGWSLIINQLPLPHHSWSVLTTVYLSICPWIQPLCVDIIQIISIIICFDHQSDPLSSEPANYAPHSVGVRQSAAEFTAEETVIHSYHLATSSSRVLFSQDTLCILLRILFNC